MGLLQKSFSAGKEALGKASKAHKAKKAAKAAKKAGGQALKEEAKQAKLARKGQKKVDRKMYGGGKKGKANKAADIARKAAARKMEDVGMGDSGESTTDTSMDGASMNKKYGASMMKKEGASMSGQKYDAKEAYNKNLSASARLHYLENNRADKKAKGGSHRSPIMKHMKNI